MTTDDNITPDPHPERTHFKLKHGTMAEIDSILKPSETREDFMRVAVAAEIQKRERKRKRRAGQVSDGG